VSAQADADAEHGRSVCGHGGMDRHLGFVFGSGMLGRMWELRRRWVAGREPPAELKMRLMSRAALALLGRVACKQFGERGREPGEGQARVRRMSRAVLALL
jgi:hypothetical protein